MSIKELYNHWRVIIDDDHVAFLEAFREACGLPEGASWEQADAIIAERDQLRQRVAELEAESAELRAKYERACQRMAALRDMIPHERYCENELPSNPDDETRPDARDATIARLEALKESK